MIGTSWMGDRGQMAGRSRSSVAAAAAVAATLRAAVAAAVAGEAEGEAAGRCAFVEKEGPEGVEEEEEAALLRTLDGRAAAEGGCTQRRRCSSAVWRTCAAARADGRWGRGGISSRAQRLLRAVGKGLPGLPLLYMRSS